MPCLETQSSVRPSCSRKMKASSGWKLIVVQAQVLLCSAKIMGLGCINFQQVFIFFLLVLQKCKKNVNFDTYSIAFLNGAIMPWIKAVFTSALASLRLVSKYCIIELKSISTELWYNTKSSVHITSWSFASMTGTPNTCQNNNNLCFSGPFNV